MTAEIIRLADRRRHPKPAETAALSRDEWNNPSTKEKALIRVLMHRISIKLGLPITSEDYGFLHRYGHLAP